MPVQRMGQIGVEGGTVCKPNHHPVREALRSPREVGAAREVDDSGDVPFQSAQSVEHPLDRFGRRVFLPAEQYDVLDHAAPTVARGMAWTASARQEYCYPSRAG